MSKYNLLWKYIKDNDINELSFDEINKVIGFNIDHSFLNYKKELLDYGYKVDKISLKNKNIKIVKIKD